MREDFIPVETPIDMRQFCPAPINYILFVNGVEFTGAVRWNVISFNEEWPVGFFNREHIEGDENTFYPLYHGKGEIVAEFERNGAIVSATAPVEVIKR